MEDLEEPPASLIPHDGLKESAAFITDFNPIGPIAECPKTNGVTDSSAVAVCTEKEEHIHKSAAVADSCDPNTNNITNSNNLCCDKVNNSIQEEPSTLILNDNVQVLSVVNEGTIPESDALLESNMNSDGIKCEESTSDVIVNDIESTSHVDSVAIETEVITDHVIDPATEHVSFETHVLVEKEETSIVTDEITIDESSSVENDVDNKIYSQFVEQNLELSEVLRSADVTDSIENNNCSTKQHIFNKEELLDILEGNDLDGKSTTVENTMKTLPKDAKAKMAYEQLNKLKGLKGKRSKSTVKSSLTQLAIQKAAAGTINLEMKPTVADKLKVKKNRKDVADATTHEIKSEEDSIVNVLVKDWEDDEPNEDIQNESSQNSDQLSNDSITPSTVSEPPAEGNESLNSNANADDRLSHKRLSRVIKKKVIFDPDNPDTYTKGKITTKNKEPQDDKEKETITTKKSKMEQVTPRPKSKSPVAKMQWKKPTPKNNKQNRRLTEVDKLLMDEGAVNMIYQLTPEAKKGKKNMRTKAELIKKINQSSKPEINEMKFRERKKESKTEDGEAKKILVSKRGSLSGSVKSACEDFETHSADDSIIYRRHSSSSYSSNCMSPRRLSDVESGIVHNLAQNQQKNHDNISSEVAASNEDAPDTDVFMGNLSSVEGSEIINKKDCQSLKEKLNSKLANVLNKRKREDKIDKPLKQKKLTLKSDKSKNSVTGPIFKTLNVNVYNGVAKITIGREDKSLCESSTYGIEELSELENALKLINGYKDTSVTLLTSCSDSFYPNLDLRPLLDQSVDKRTKYALDLTESIKGVLTSMEEHNKLIVGGVSGTCEGLALAMLTLCDVSVASDCSVFALFADQTTPMIPGVAALTHCQGLSQNLKNELVLFGRRLSANEALHHGLINRILWPERFHTELSALAVDMASQPTHNLLLKKQLLKASKVSRPESTFHKKLTAEQDLIAAYWTSLEGQQVLKAHLKSKPAK